MSFVRFLDAGILGPDGARRVLELRGHVTSKVAGTVPSRYFYTSTPARATKTLARGVVTMDWDASGQTLWSASPGGGEPRALVRPGGGTFPGDVAAAPGGRYVVYPLTRKTTWRPDPKHPALFPKFDPFITDSSLVILDVGSGTRVTALSGRYNRRLFAAFSGFSPDGSYFYTVAREGNGFRFVRVSLGTGKVTGFGAAFPRFSQVPVPWDDFFNRSGRDFNFASFSISPDARTLIATRDSYQHPSRPTCREPAYHDVWVFHLDSGAVRHHPKRPGYVSSATWKPDGSAFALSLVSHAGCYPQYLESSIVIHDRGGNVRSTLLRRPQSKITTIGWSPDGRSIAFDIYGTDLVGHLQRVSVASGKVTDLIDTRKLGHPPDHGRPVTVLFSGWLTGR